jgi:hypothetical protein
MRLDVARAVLTGRRRDDLEITLAACRDAVRRRSSK